MVSIPHQEGSASPIGQSPRIRQQAESSGTGCFRLVDRPEVVLLKTTIHIADREAGISKNPERWYIRDFAASQHDRYRSAFFRSS